MSRSKVRAFSVLRFLPVDRVAFLRRLPKPFPLVLVDTKDAQSRVLCSGWISSWLLDAALGFCDLFAVSGPCVWGLHAGL